MASTGQPDLFVTEMQPDLFAADAAPAYRPDPDKVRARTTLALILKRTEANRTLTGALCLLRQNFLPRAHDPRRGRCAPVWPTIMSHA